MSETGGPDPNWRARGPEPEGAESRRLPDEVFEGEVRPSADPDAPRRRFNMPFGRGARERQEAARREAEVAAARAAVDDAGGPGAGPETSFGYEDYEDDTVPIRPTAPFTGATPDEVRGAGGGRGDRVSRARRLLNRVRRDRAQPLSPDEALDRDLDEAAPVIPPGGIIRTPLPPPEPTVFERGRARVGAAYQATDEWGNRVAGGVRRGTEVTRDGVVAGTRATGRAARRGAEATRDAAVDVAHAAHELAYPEVEPIYDALPMTRQWPPPDPERWPRGAEQSRYTGMVREIENDILEAEPGDTGAVALGLPAEDIENIVDILRYRHVISDDEPVIMNRQRDIKARPRKTPGQWARSRLKDGLKAGIPSGVVTGAAAAGLVPTGMIVPAVVGAGIGTAQQSVDAALGYQHFHTGTQPQVKFEMYRVLPERDPEDPGKVVEHSDMAVSVQYVREKSKLKPPLLPEGWWPGARWRPVAINVVRTEPVENKVTGQTESAAFELVRGKPAHTLALRMAVANSTMIEQKFEPSDNTQALQEWVGNEVGNAAPVTIEEGDPRRRRPESDALLYDAGTPYHERDEEGGDYRPLGGGHP